MVSIDPRYINQPPETRSTSLLSPLMCHRMLFSGGKICGYHSESNLCYHKKSAGWHNQESNTVQACNLILPTGLKLRPDSGYASPTSTNKSSITSSNYKLYPIRWYILFLFSCFAMTQYCLWNTFGPISTTMKKSFGWSNADIALLANWDPVIYVLFSLQICWLVGKKGLRRSLIISLGFTAFGSGMRCLSSNPSMAKWLFNLGQLFNGLAGIVAQACGPILSSSWFPPNERATATAVSSIFTTLGIAVSFIIGPLFVQEDLQNYKNYESIPRSPNSTNFQGLNLISIEARQSVMKLLYYEFGFCVLLLVLVISYFPNKPLTPPSQSACVPRLDFKEGFKQVSRNINFWIVVFVAAATTGLYSGWAAVISVNFKAYDLGLTQTDIGWIGFCSTMTGMAGGLCMGRLADAFPRHSKAILITLYVFATLSFGWMALMCIQAAEYTMGNLYQACLFGSFCINGSIPLIYELVIELTFPAPETVSIGILTLTNNAFTFAFLLVLTIPDMPTNWMNWCLVLICFLGIIAMAFFKDSYKRLAMDRLSELSLSTESKSNELCSMKTSKAIESIHSVLGNIV